jgi:hypothetical protein
VTEDLLLLLLLLLAEDLRLSLGSVATTEWRVEASTARKS